MARIIPFLSFAALVVAPVAAPVAAQGLDGDALKQALGDEAASFWIYDDLPAAEKQAKATGKPLLISFRCVP